MPGIAERERKTRDLRSQIAGLGSDLGGEIVFQHIRTRRGLVTLYATLDGEPIPIPEYMVASVMAKTLPDGRYMFTDNRDEVPEYKRGEVKCFLHAESSERASGILDEIGLAGKYCPAGSLSSAHSKRMHGQHRHKQEWAAYQEYLDEQKEAKQIARQQEQLDATLAIARGSGGQPVPPDSESEFLDKMSDKVWREPEKVLAAVTAKGECDICGKTGLKNVGAHKRGAHNA